MAALGRPSLKPNLDKILESILFLMEVAEENSITLTQYVIAKTLFVADEHHLNEYGRPITFDNYVAMKHGPVPSASYDLLKPSFDWARHFGMKSAPWQRKKHRGYAIEFKCPERQANTDILSASDTEKLSAALIFVNSLGVSGTRDYTHRHPAWKNAWDETSVSRSFPIDYNDMLAEKDEDLIDEVVEASHYQ